MKIPGKARRLLTKTKRKASSHHDCKKCRGYKAGPVCQTDRKMLLQNFENLADNNLHAQFRREIFSWGFCYIYSGMIARRLARRFKY